MGRLVTLSSWSHGFGDVRAIVSIAAVAHMVIDAEDYEMLGSNAYAGADG